MNDLARYRVRTFAIQSAAQRLRLNRPPGRLRATTRLLERWAIRWSHRHGAAYAGRLHWKEIPRYDIATREILVWWRAVPDAGANLQAIERTIAPDPEHFGGFVNIAEAIGDPAAPYYDSPQRPQTV